MIDIIWCGVFKNEMINDYEKENIFIHYAFWACLFIISVITHSLCVFVCGLNAMRVSGDQGESHVGERGT